MARYPSSRRSGRRGRSRNRIYIVSGLLIIAAVIAFVWNNHRFGKKKEKEEEIISSSTSTNAGNATEPYLITAPKPPMEIEPNLSAIPPEPTAESDPEADKLIAEAVAFVNTKPSRIIEARDILNDALSLPMSQQQRAFVKNKLSQLADKWLFSRSIFPQDRLCSTYQVRPGDQLRTIGARFKVPYEILMQINNIARPEALRAGETIKVINGPFHTRVYRSTFTMDLYLQNTFVRSFRVGLGKPGMETPTGLWRVKPGGKLIKPAWTDPITGKTYNPTDPDYPLGSRWIGLEGIEGEAKDRTGFAIHGTKKPDEIGTAGSQGCIRLHNGDVILMYKLLMPGFSLVRVVE